MRPDKPIVARLLDPAYLIFCTKCACHYTDNCDKHSSGEPGGMRVYETGTLLHAYTSAPSKGAGGYTYG